jgi:anti-sigma B factor antagonist
VDLLTVSVTARESAGEAYTLVEIAGEADVTNTEELRSLLDEEVAQEPRTLIIDLSGLRFMDSSALHALLRVRWTAREACSPWSLRRPPWPRSCG